MNNLTTFSFVFVSNLCFLTRKFSYYDNMFEISFLSTQLSSLGDRFSQLNARGSRGVWRAMAEIRHVELC